MTWPPLTELTASVKTGKRTATELVKQALEEIEKKAEFHTLLEINKQALAKAQAIDKRIKAGNTDGALLGAPYIAKDNFLTLGTKTTAASKMLDNFKAPYQATVIEKLEAEGAILLGKANLDAFMQGSSTENSDFGPTKNPHNPGHVPGGSSGGSAASVVLEQCAFALGSDTGGSIRQPASFCGCVGLRPTYGLVSRYGVVAMVSSMDTIGPITRSVADTAYILDILAGPDRRDSTTIDRQQSYRDLAKLKNLKVGIIKNHIGEGVQAEVVAAVQQTSQLLAGQGAAVKEIEIEHENLALAAYYIIVPAEISSNLARYDGVKYGHAAAADDLLSLYEQTRGQGFNAENIRRILIGTYVLSTGYYDAYYKRAQQVRTLLRQSYERAFRDVDVLIGPVAPTTTFKLGQNTADPLQMYLGDAMTVGVSLAGVPAISVPIGKDKQGLPIGLQIIGPQRQDLRVLQVAKMVEELV